MKSAVDLRFLKINQWDLQKVTRSLIRVCFTEIPLKMYQRNIENLGKYILSINIEYIVTVTMTVIYLFTYEAALLPPIGVNIPTMNWIIKIFQYFKNKMLTNTLAATLRFKKKIVY